MAHCGYCDSPFGLLKIVAQDDKITYIGRCTAVEEPPSPSELTDLAVKQLEQYFAKERTAFDLPLAPFGTPFQRSVWDALLEIPYGETRSYQDIANTIGNPKATRAVGMACNKNPIWIAIPCHRVVGANRKLTGYAGGLDMKQSLLNLEQR